MSAEPESSSPPPTPASTPASAPVTGLAVTPTPKAEILPGDHVTQSDTAEEATQQSGLPASAPVKVPGFENLDTFLNEKDTRSRGVFVLMHQEIVRLREVIREKDPFVKDFYDQRQNAAVLKEQLKNEEGRNETKARGVLVADVWFGLAMAAAGALICHADAMPDGHLGTQIGFVVLAVIVGGAGAFTKWVMK